MLTTGINMAIDKTAPQDQNLLKGNFVGVTAIP